MNRKTGSIDPVFDEYRIILRYYDNKRQKCRWYSQELPPAFLFVSEEDVYRPCGFHRKCTAYLPLPMGEATKRSEVGEGQECIRSFAAAFRIVLPIPSASLSFGTSP